MATLFNDFPEVVAPTADDAQLAQESCRLLTRIRGGAGNGPVRLRVESDDTSTEAVVIPQVAFRLLTEILGEMAQGHALTILPVQAELTTQRAADLLNVSRPFLVEQLEHGKIPFRKVGKHRRVLLTDLLRYKRAIDRQRLETLEQLSAVDQELGLGY